jgi:CheY-like chemotaxis protein
MEKKKILIVEDERIVAEDIRTKLEYVGYVVAGMASSGEESLKKTEKLQPDLVLMDIVLEGKMDGIEKGKGHRAIRLYYQTFRSPGPLHSHRNGPLPAQTQKHAERERGEIQCPF